jgi:hypothetical protein
VTEKDILEFEKQAGRHAALGVTFTGIETGQLQGMCHFAKKGINNNEINRLTARVAELEAESAEWKARALREGEERDKFLEALEKIAGGVLVDVIGTEQMRREEMQEIAKVAIAPEAIPERPMEITRGVR